MRPEIEIIILALRSSLDGDRERRLRQLLAEKLDWHFLCLAAVGHQVCSPLSELLEKFGVNQNLTILIRQESKEIQRQNEILVEKLCRLQPLLNQAGTAFAVMDGALISGPVNGTVRNRPVCYIDLFAQSKDVPRLAEILAQQGFHPTQNWSSPQPNQFFSTPAFLKLENAKEYIFRSHGKRIPINLRWRTETRFGTGDQMLKCTVEQEFAGSMMRTLEPDLLFTYLCANAAQHNWERLVWISDIARALESEQVFNWPEIARLSRKMGLFGTVQTSVSLANALFDVEIPKAMLPINPPLLNLVCKTVKNYDLMVPPVVSFSELPKWRRIWHTFDSKIQVAQQIAVDLVKPRYSDWVRLKLPEQFLWLFYLIRPAGKGYILGRKILKFFPFKRSHAIPTIAVPAVFADDQVMWDRLAAGEKFKQPENVSENYQRVLTGQLLAHAMGEFAGSKIYGQWLDQAPNAVSKARLDKLVNDEIKHAKLIMALLEPFGYDRKQLDEQFNKNYQAFFLKPVESWNEFVVFNLLLDGGADHYLRDYANCSWEPWCTAMSTIAIDEETHLANSDLWIEEAARDPVSKASIQHALDKWLPTIEEVFGTSHSKQTQEACIYGIRLRHADEISRLWHEELEAQLTKHGYKMPSQQPGSRSERSSS